jgi:hypothetical protein
MKNYFNLLTLLSALTFCACDSKNLKQVADTASLAEPQAIDQQVNEKVENVTERKVIKEGEIKFEVADVIKTKSLIAKTVQELGGYISKDEVFDYTNKLEHRLVIRIPAEKFDLLLSKVSESAEKLDSKNINILDVTEEYIDIDTRVKTKKELEDRYKALLKQATKVEEILTIEKEIGKLREEIESVEGRLRYLKDRISLSSLTVTYYQKTNSAFGFSSRFGQAIRNGWDGFLLFCIGLTNLWVFILLAILGAYVYILFKRRKKKTGQ